MGNIIKFEKSCGVVIYRKIGKEIEFLSVSAINDGHWGFPKGHVEKDENEQQTAIREVKEETGLKVILIDGFRESVDYLIKNEKIQEEITKQVVFFLAKVEEKSIYIQIDEIKDYKWQSYHRTYKTLTYKTSKEVLEKAYEFIKLFK